MTDLSKRSDTRTGAVVDTSSRRQRVLTCLRRAVERLRRPVRLDDIAAQVALEGEVSLRRNDISAYLGSLEKSGAIITIGRVQGLRSGGTRLLLPTDCDAKDFPLSVLLTWPEIVHAAFQRLWQKEVACAGAEYRQPTPISHAQVRAELGTHEDNREQLGSPGRLTAALRTLCGTKTPRLRRVGVSPISGSNFVPTGVPDGALGDMALLRIRQCPVATAVGRASTRAGSYTVSRAAILTELELDPDLIPHRAGRRERNLEGASRTVISERGGSRRRVSQKISKVGRVGNETIYCVGVPTPEAEREMASRRVLLAWKNAKAQTELLRLADVSIPSLRHARALELMHVCRKAQSALTEASQVSQLKEAGSLGPGENAFFLEASAAAKQALEIEARAYTYRLKNAPRALGGAEVLGKTSPRCTQDELHVLLRQASVEGFAGPNTDIRGRFSFRSRRMGGVLDRVEARLIIAEKWGGRESTAHAAVAIRELGRIRNPLPVAMGLAHRSLDIRLAAIECAAFLEDPTLTSTLHNLALSDEEPGVRWTALWAYGFSGGCDALDITRQVADSDRSPLIRAEAEAYEGVVRADPRGWLGV